MSTPDPQHLALDPISGRYTDDGLYRPSDFEVATGWVFGFEDRAPDPPPAPQAAGPRAGFEAALLPALVRAPCVVAFSGGRDSSAVLAVATHLARREGLPDPIPATHDFGGTGDTDERRFQELLIRELGLRDWHRSRDDAGYDILGDRARRSLERQGPLWPALLHAHEPLVELAAGGGSFIVGEGGDEVLGTHRVSAVRRVIKERYRPGPRTMRTLAEALAPAGVRRRWVCREARAADLFPWLRPDVAEAAVHLLARDMTDAPLRWDEAVRKQNRRRAAVTHAANSRRLFAARDVTYHEPFLDPAFVEPLARTGGRRGWISRTSMMSMFFGDVVPDEICGRTQKATFNAVAVGDATRAFLADWTGEGLDPEIVDVEALRAAVTAEVANRFAFLLVQRAWLAVHRPSAVPT